MKEIYKLHRENPKLETVNIIHLYPTNELGMGKSKRFKAIGYNLSLRESIFIGYADTITSYYSAMDLLHIRIMNDDSIMLTFKREVGFKKDNSSDIIKIEN